MRDREKTTSEPEAAKSGVSDRSAGPASPGRAAISFTTLPDPPSDEEVARIAAKLGAPISL
ncbi:hypothetical protein [Sphingomonas astaxanthinifaciens]|uniref:Uncharacterized protein n=1 Tax=Sphingomonas astaxanthinifaciens DSM 22298 TaxID=1123267 RepID=A0ABQ5Z9K5_9SPHN|nr:hypothetical protein [Sphingomonas astaxanthinifaciens]GLR48617.1 hypothetical protein GCM10007925_23350 [Sphingomonas astaxanthinifaciens DSM 22298]